MILLLQDRVSQTALRWKFPKFSKIIVQSGDGLGILGHPHRLSMYQNFKTNQYFGFGMKYVQYATGAMVQ